MSEKNVLMNKTQTGDRRRQIARHLMIILID